MDKVLVVIRIPALGGNYNFSIPTSMEVRDILSLIVKILNAEYGIIYDFNNVVLIDCQDHRALPLNATFSDLNVSDGTELMLV